ncbi:MAG TPA: UDP-2,4-diacetamido-2,4,6-trideoxy-beta-L-altropyranose hydrolase [Alphaproteobacteria bacterium]|jgi:UDP-2,4-diacetamido-2,4,6-trideoxy-beta-L-altropyranose hydrolase|nr:UDP-2,4-diacetamido-2,4,6-trideoxy-beta-L-altropyranose hydrolase [Alphaproteobacteria bacterium]HJN60424.1 UDP-2,4-diacetamido-2,4,6-trideoxy-beta-L-altropyranose hydrolase [Alphaproteobacteria bacterium]
MNAGAPLAVFRADAGSVIGWGHVMRCAALAQALRGAGWRCAWATAADTAAMTARLAARFDEVVALAADRDEPTQMRARWPRGCRLLVIDHYERDAGYASTCRGWADSILAIDDLGGREHDCDLLLDAAPGRTEGDYRGRVPYHALCLLGPAYAMLMPDFAAARHHVLPRRYAGGARRILLGLGATNPRGMLDKVLDAIEQASVRLAPDLVLARNTPDGERLTARVARAGGQVHVDVENMAELMAASDIAVGAGGISAWERCSLGLPTLLLVIADNQRANAEALAAAGAAQIVEPETGALVGAINALAGDGAALERMSRAASRLADGLGAIRVGQAVAEMPRARDGQAIRLRPASAEDSDIILALQCQPETRRYARNPDIPSPAEHSCWMRGKLDDPGCLMNLILHGETVAGVARLDRRPEGYEVSIAVDPARFRLGIAGIALALLHQLVPEADLLAHVKSENIASRTLFRRAGYSEAEQGDWLRRRALS